MNKQHVKWLLEGAKKWNERRKEEPFQPDLDNLSIASFDTESPFGAASFDKIDFSKGSLRNATLVGVKLRSANLSGCDLSSCVLWACDLSEANISHADFSNSELYGTKFNNAIAHNANFRNAYLFGGNMQGANLHEANFGHANFKGTRIKGADLSSSNLVGADMDSTAPWEATIFPDETIRPVDIETLGKDYSVSSVSDVIDLSGIIRKCYDNNYNVYFRGEGCSQWKLCPSIMRESQIRDNEGNMLHDLMSSRPEEFILMKSALSQWVLAQHHGLRTRLLDVTKNPLVALFYACDDVSSTKHDGILHVFVIPKNLVKSFNSDSISVITNFAKLSRAEQKSLLGYRNIPSDQSYRRILGRLYNHIGHENPYFKEKIDPRDFFRIFVVEPQQSFERIRAQAGAFIISAFHERFERDHILNLNGKTPVYNHYRIKVSSGSKRDILRDLAFINVKREVLLPGLDESAKAIIEKYR